MLGVLLARLDRFYGVRAWRVVLTHLHSRWFPDVDFFKVGHDVVRNGGDRGWSVHSVRD